MERYYKRKSTLESQEVNEVKTTPRPTHGHNNISYYTFIF